MWRLVRNPCACQSEWEKAPRLLVPTGGDRTQGNEQDDESKRGGDMKVNVREGKKVASIKRADGSNRAPNLTSVLVPITTYINVPKA